MCMFYRYQYYLLASARARERDIIRYSYHLLVQFVVVGDVLLERSHDDGGKNSSEEEDDDEGVENGEPVDLSVSHLQVDVPARRPLYFTLFPHQRVGEVYLHRL